ncbi:MAG TPA: hypothetical protein PKA00_04910 [Saprospiraceae bacterium]|nr:hypothetical protein [Saprospiraceae bacterium]HMQ82222.1 hypothetical protein [Saprospiraceae bacterium]
MRKVIYARLLGYLFLVGVMSACKQDEEPIIISEVEDEFYVEMQEAFLPEGRSLQLLISTIALEECLHTSIDVDYFRLSNTASITINEITPISDCNPGMAPATALVNFGPIDTPTLPLSIDIRGAVVNNGSIAVNEDYYRMYMEIEGGIVVNEDLLRRIPEGTIWGGVLHDESQESQLAAQSLLQDIEALSKSQQLLAGNYGYFEVDDSGMSFKESTPLADAEVAFQYQLKESSQQLKAIIEQYRSEYGSRLGIFVYDTLGTVY